MSPDELSRLLSGRIPGLFECSPAPFGRLRVETPMLYPDRDLVDVFVAERGETWCVTDLGEALGWMGLQSVSDRRSAKQDEVIGEICRDLQVTLRRGQLELRVSAVADLAEAVVRIAQAVVRVADTSFLSRPRAPRELRERVGEWLSVKQVPFEPKCRLDGRSGEKWTVDYRTSAQGATSLVWLLDGDSKSAARQRAEHVVAGWHDLRYLKENGDGPAMISLFDDTRGEWEKELLRMVEPLSEVALWSQRDRFERMLVGAAPTADEADAPGSPGRLLG